MNAQDSSDIATRVARAVASIRSADALTRNEGVSAALAIGAPVVPALLEMVDEPGDSRADAMYVLASVGDSRAKSAFDRGLEDANEHVRAYAARGLHRIGDPAALDALVRTIDDAADPLHLDRTPSVEAMADTGLKGARAVLDLLLHESPLTRLHAQRALEGIVARKVAVAGGRGQSAEQIGEQVAAEWRAHGDYAYDADESRRVSAVAELRRWLMSQQEDAWKA